MSLFSYLSIYLSISTNLSIYLSPTVLYLSAQSAGAVEYTDFTFEEGSDPTKRVSKYNIKPSDGETEGFDFRRCSKNQWNKSKSILLSIIISIYKVAQSSGATKE